MMEAPSEPTQRVKSYWVITGCGHAFPDRTSDFIRRTWGDNDTKGRKVRGVGVSILCLACSSLTRVDAQFRRWPDDLDTLPWGHPTDPRLLDAQAQLRKEGHIT